LFLFSSHGVSIRAVARHAEIGIEEIKRRDEHANPTLGERPLCPPGSGHSKSIICERPLCANSGRSERIEF
jgi:hypothetical protein